MLAEVEDEGVPVGAGGGGDVEDSGRQHVCLGGRSPDGHVEDEAVEAAVADEQVAAAAEDEEGQIAVAGEARRLRLSSDSAGDLAEEAGRPADAKGGVGGERDLLLEDGGREGARV